MVKSDRHQCVCGILRLLILLVFFSNLNSSCIFLQFVSTWLNMIHGRRRSAVRGIRRTVGDNSRTSSNSITFQKMSTKLSLSKSAAERARTELNAKIKVNASTMVFCLNNNSGNKSGKGEVIKKCKTRVRSRTLKWYRPVGVEHWRRYREVHWQLGGSNSGNGNGNDEGDGKD